jgi:hypothetical protein
MTEDIARESAGIYTTRKQCQGRDYFDHLDKYVTDAEKVAIRECGMRD